MHSPLATPKATIAVLQKFDLYTKKRLGQHFLIDDTVIGRILAAAALQPDDQVLEIGPGIGVLTLALLAAAGQVLALEKDAALLDALAYTTASHCTKGNPQLTVLNVDALDLPRLKLPSRPTKLVANLPYQVAATNVLDCFEYLPTITQATVMVQREVAQRMAATPGSKIYGAYSAKLGLLARPAASFAVARNSFLPPPRVDSSVITLIRHDDVDSIVKDHERYKAVATLIDTCFASRRKTIFNNLRAAKNGEDARLTKALKDAGISPTARAETLGSADFVSLLDALR
ncbi:MAG: 16S rRNA (adenine(1518)-N(6)/adenine(1519)-N(6))-dimethyltransferase RsmA [Coriobacteriia bacterium]|nr:16S rRNA (adenine(1518)-N(6)/adenine(1519)-N(6))-dimethyltransferase RsmA [Coriobacteriia bacterium]